MAYSAFGARFSNSKSPKLFASTDRTVTGPSESIPSPPLGPSSTISAPSPQASVSAKTTLPATKRLGSAMYVTLSFMPYSGRIASVTPLATSRATSLSRIVQVAEPQCPGRTRLDAARLFPPAVKQVGTKRAFLGELLLFVPEDHPVRATAQELLVAGGLLRVDDDDAVFSPDRWRRERCPLVPPRHTEAGRTACRGWPRRRPSSWGTGRVPSRQDASNSVLSSAGRRSRGGIRCRSTRRGRL